MSLVFDNVLLDGARVAIVCDGGTIEAIGPDAAAGLAPSDSIDGRGMHLVPPFVNAHTHAAMTLFRGYGDDLPLMTWLETKIWPAEAKLTDDDVYWGTRLAAIEMIRSGTTRFFDVYWHAEGVARAVNDSGIRATPSAVLLDGLDPAKGKEMRAGAIASLDALADAGPLITPCLGPHAIYTVSAESLAWIAEIAAERELPIQIHLSETEGEVADCLAAHGMRPAHYLDSLGMLGPRTILGHGVWLDREELELIAERGSTVATNPAANMKLAVGAAFPFPAAAEAGVAIGLGTDGVSSNSNLDMFEEVKLLALLQKHTTGRAEILPAPAALEIARGRRSAALGGTPLEPGQPADFLLIRSDAPELSAGELDAGLVYAAHGDVVDTTVVAGRVLMSERRIDGIEEVVAETAARAASLTS